MGEPATVLAPTGKTTKLAKLNEDLEIGASTGPCEAFITNGSIRAHNVSGPVLAHVMNGSIQATFDASPKALLDLSVTNGDIRVSLPREAHVNISARAVNGAIKSDFTLTLDGEISQERLEGKIGKGGPRLKLTVNNGTIHIERIG